VARLAFAALLVLCVTACSSSKQSATTATTTGPVESPIVVETPVPNSQWRSPLTVKGTSSLSGKLTAEVLDASGKQLGSEDTTASNGGFSVKVTFTVKKLAPGAVLVHDEGSEHSVQIPLVLTP
jgi:Immunoglobulin-like domain of bacterial spore germination